MTRRVVVTGLGGVCATGANVPEFWENLKAGKCGIDKRTYSAGEGLDITLPVAPVDNFETRAAELGRDMTRADRFTQFAIAAADEAVADSGIDLASGLGARTAAIIGTGIGGQAAMDAAYIGMLRHGRRPHP
ncbi:MAG TPA: beta-ketoacyl synthase N-terminal-like domain-containing protein, partial [Amphiplicatus sp.]|nr:beta-ketoacyl synthase N-terminal-like domain-containing protein [Amphiplicatus sp.]